MDRPTVKIFIEYMLIDQIILHYKKEQTYFLNSRTYINVYNVFCSLTDRPTFKYL